MARQLPTVQIEGKNYFIGDRLKEYLQTDNPHNRIAFDEIGDRKLELVEKGEENLFNKKRQRKSKRRKGL